MTLALQSMWFWVLSETTLCYKHISTGSMPPLVEERKDKGSSSAPPTPVSEGQGEESLTQESKLQAVQKQGTSHLLSSISRYWQEERKLNSKHTLKKPASQRDLLGLISPTSITFSCRLGDAPRLPPNLTSSLNNIFYLSRYLYSPHHQITVSGVPKDSHISSLAYG